jgi:hypothetical protein
MHNCVCCLAIFTPCCAFICLSSCCRYLTLFAAVFPAAAPLCLLLTLAKIKLDCLRLTAVQQRPVPLQLAGIGAWNSVLTVLVSGGAVAVVAVVAFSSCFVAGVKQQHMQGCGYDSTLFVAGWKDKTCRKGRQQHTVSCAWRVFM